MLIPAFTASARRLAPPGTSISFFSLTNFTMGMVGSLVMETQVIWQKAERGYVTYRTVVRSLVVEMGINS